MSTPPASLRAARRFPNVFKWLLNIHPSTIHGEAEFMNASEMKNFLNPQNQGIYFSEAHRLSLSDSFTNLALLAPTGTGKTTSYVIPNILKCSGSCVVTDPSGEIFQKTSGYMKQQGYTIYTFEPENIERSDQFNPLAWARDKKSLKQLATTIAQNTAGKDPFWTTMAVNVMYMGLVALTAQPNPDYRNLSNLRWLLNHFGVEGEGIASFMSAHLDAFMFSEFQAFIAQDSKVIASILSSARAALDLWSDENIMALTAKNTIDIDTLRTEKAIVYLMIPEHQVQYYALILNLFYSSCFGYCLDTLPQKNDLPVFFFLDEFGNMGEIYNFPAIATTLRKRGCSLNIVLQTLSQLDAIYGKDNANTIFQGGMLNKLFLSGLDADTCRFVAEVLGENTLYDTTFGGFDDHSRTIAKPLLSASEVRMLPPEQGILVSNRQKPVQVHIPPYYKTALKKYCSVRAVTRESRQKTIAYLPLP